MFGKTTPEKQLFKAIKCGDLDGVKALIDGRVDNGLDIDCVFKNDDTPLTFAIAQKKYKIALYLIEKNANVNKRGRTYANKADQPLSICISDSNVRHSKSLARKTVEALVEKGANFHGFSGYYSNALHFLSSRNYSYSNLFEYCLSKVKSLDELEDYTNSDGATLKDILVTSSPFETCYATREAEIKAQGTTIDNVIAEKPQSEDAPNISDVADIHYERIGSHTLCVTTPLPDKGSLLEVFNFAHKRIVTSIDKGTPAQHRFSDADQDGLQFIANKLDELGGHAGEDWKEVFSNTIRKGKAILPKGVIDTVSKNVASNHKAALNTFKF